MDKDNRIMIEVKNLAKIYQLRTQNGHQHSPDENFYALKDVSFNVYKGEVMGIIGNNGSGKSTLLKILSQITKPSSGEAKFYGEVSSILDIGTNFHPDLTGRENVNMHLHLAGVKTKDFKEHYASIQEFSEIDAFFDQPVKVYSSGMFLRLAFSVAFQLSSDILVLDEVLSVGDEGFRLKCHEMIIGLTRKGHTILFVSHSRNEIIEMSSRCLWLDKGRVKRVGDPVPVLGEYISTNRDNFDNTKLVIDTNSSHPAHTERSSGVEIAWDSDNPPGNEVLDIRALSVSSLNGSASLYNTEPVQIRFLINKKKAGISIGAFFYIQDVLYQPVLVGHFLNNLVNEDFSAELKDKTGLFEIKCLIPPGFLTPGKYYLFPRFGTTEHGWSDTSPEAFRFSEKLSFTITPSPGYKELIGDISKGSARPALDWGVVRV